MNKKDTIKLQDLYNEFLVENAGKDLCLDCVYKLKPHGRQRKPRCGMHDHPLRGRKIIQDGAGVECTYYDGPAFDSYVAKRDPELAERAGRLG